MNVPNPQFGQLPSPNSSGTGSLGSPGPFLPFKVPSGGASSNALTWASLSARGVPLVRSLVGQVTPEDRVVGGVGPTRRAVEQGEGREFAPWGGEVHPLNLAPTMTWAR